MSVGGYFTGGRSCDELRWCCGTDRKGCGVVAYGVSSAKGVRWEEDGPRVDIIFCGCRNLDRRPVKGGWCQAQIVDGVTCGRAFPSDGGGRAEKEHIASSKKMTDWSTEQEKLGLWKDMAVKRCRRGSQTTCDICWRTDNPDGVREVLSVAGK